MSIIDQNKISLHSSNHAHVAQLAEHFLGKEEVMDSNSVVGLAKKLGRF